MLDRTRPTGQSLPFTAARNVRAAIARLGRTEDVAYSPDGSRIAIVAIVAHRLLVLDVETQPMADRPRIALTGFVELESPAFHEPHGIAWADEGTLIVVNRRGHIAIVAVPEVGPASPIEIEPMLVIGADGRDLVVTPGAVAVRPIGMGLIELLVCNNHVDHVTRHLLDRRDGCRVLASEILVGEGLSVPDGVAQSPSGQWIAISNHHAHNVLLFRDADASNGGAGPDGVLTGLTYPHGLTFSGDEKTLLVADAGAPFVHIFRSEDGDWSGPRSPSDAIRVFSDKIFRGGNFSPADGGPKGVDLSPDDRVMVTSCEEQPIAFFDMRGLLPPADPAPPGPDEAGEADRARATMVRYLATARKRTQQENEGIRRAGRFEREALIAREEEIRAFLTSRSWRLTAPLRWLYRRLQKAKRRRGN